MDIGWVSWVHFAPQPRVKPKGGEEGGAGGGGGEFPIVSAVQCRYCCYQYDTVPTSIQLPHAQLVHTLPFPNVGSVWAPWGCVAHCCAAAGCPGP